VNKSREALQLAKKKGYAVTDEGIVISEKGTVIKLNKTSGKTQYLKFNIKLDGVSRSVRVHRLAALQKHGECMFNEGIQVRHLDGNSLNNHIHNLALGTQSDNMMDRSKEDRLASAIHASNSMTKFDADKVRAYHNISKSYKKTMSQFDIPSKGTLHYILNK